MKRKRFKKIVVTSLPKGLLNLNPIEADKLKNIGEVILAVGAAMGVGLITLIAPNALQLLQKAPGIKKSYTNLFSKDLEEKQKLTRGFYYLKRQGLIELVPQGDNYLMSLTEKGQKKVVEMDMRSISIPKSRKWDGYWWFIIADIPTEMRSQANLFRQKLKDLNIFTLQRSVWVYPFSPKRELTFISAFFGLENYVTIFKATELENEDETRLKTYYHKLLRP
ncbi:MAG: hypothetical protein WC794_05555 [Candidatus Doudnabacteria bacterium]|jgi:hypothetical protein